MLPVRSGYHCIEKIIIQEKVMHQWKLLRFRNVDDMIHKRDLYHWT